MVGHEGNKNGKDDYQPGDSAGIKWVQVSAEYQGDCRGDNRQNGENVKFHLVVSLRRLVQLKLTIAWT